jgi:hypothetical protein
VADKILTAKREAFLRKTEGCKIWRVNRLPWPLPNRAEPRGDDIYSHSRRLLAEAPEQWPDGASLSDVIETYAPNGTLSQYEIIAELCQWSVVESAAGLPSLELRRWRRVTEEQKARLKALEKPGGIPVDGQEALST